MIVLWCVLAVVYGGLVVELLPRAAYRLGVERGQPWTVQCPAGHPLPSGVLGWAGRARCPECRASYGSVPWAARGVGVVASVALVLGTGGRPELAVWLLLIPFGLLLGVVDVRVRRLPDVVTLPMAAGTAVLLGVVELLPGESGSWPGALLGAAALGAFYFLLFLISPDGMGFGDVKLALTAGLALGWYGWGVVFLGTLAGLFLGAVVGLALILGRRAHRRTALPFGPYLLSGALGGVLFGAFSA